MKNVREQATQTEPSSFRLMKQIFFVFCVVSCEWWMGKRERKRNEITQNRVIHTKEPLKGKEDVK